MVVHYSSHVYVVCFFMFLAGMKAAGGYFLLGFLYVNASKLD